MLIKSRSLEEILNYKTIIFYGIGNQCRECMKLFQDRDIILVDSDNKKWGKNYGKTQIIHGPQIIEDCYEKGKAAIVISALFNQYEIAEFLVNQCAVQEEDLFSYTHGEYEKWVYNPKLIYEHEKDIRICLDMVEDEASKEYYFNSVNARIQRNPLLLKPNTNAKRTGEYGDIVRLEKGDAIIDCGAYTGDTAHFYMDHLDGDCTIYAVEPFQDNFLNLCNRIRENGWEEKVIPYNYALGLEHEEKEIHYNDGDFEMAINLSKAEGHKVQKVVVESLDILFAGKKVDYIKMDIEGAEADAIRGAKTLIRENRPKLMISAYHKVSDLWEIPVIIKEICSDYKIYVGHAPGVSTEIEFYCIAEDKGMA